MRNNKKEQLVKLQALTSISFETVQIEMAEIGRLEDELRSQLRNLSKIGKVSSADLNGNLDPAVMAGADLRWQRWADHKKRMINSELANVLARKENCRNKLIQAFGRNEAVGGLIEKATKQQQSHRDRDN